MEKLIYVSVVEFGDDDLFCEEAYTRSRNNWYAITQKSDGASEINPVFEGINHLNYPGPALLDTTCRVIGSRIYVIGGEEVTNRYWTGGRATIEDIRFINTHNPEQGWTKCFTLPFASFILDTIAVHDQWLYIWPGRHFPDSKNPWCYAVNFGDNKEERAREISSPCDHYPPTFAGTLSPGKLLVYMASNETLYELDSVNYTWSVNQKLSYKRLELMPTSVIFDGLLYMYDPVFGRLTCFDIANKKERYVTDEFPESHYLCSFMVLSKDRFCILEPGAINCPSNQVHIHYRRFSVSLDMQKPNVILEEEKAFYVTGRMLVDAVAADPHSDLKNSWSCNSRVDMANHPTKKARV